MLEIKSFEKKDYVKMAVIGVGGGGNNAIDRMINEGISGVDFIAANTDAQVLDANFAPIKIQLGKKLTEGLGAGSDPTIGEKSALESLDELETLLEGYRLVFITCGMGGGTGSGAAHVIAKTCMDKGILTVAIVTKPFGYEGYCKFRFIGSPIPLATDQCFRL